MTFFKIIHIKNNNDERKLNEYKTTKLVINIMNMKLLNQRYYYYFSRIIRDHDYHDYTTCIVLYNARLNIQVKIIKQNNEIKLINMLQDDNN